MLNPTQSFVRRLFKHLGLTRDHFPALRVFRMNKNSFFGDKFKMGNELFSRNTLHAFLSKIMHRDARVYRKAQDFRGVQTYNFRQDKKIKSQLGMKLLHNENFRQVIDRDQVNAGYLLFVFANREMCEKCDLYERKVIESFGMVGV